MAKGSRGAKQRSTVERSVTRSGRIKSVAKSAATAAAGAAQSGISLINIIPQSLSFETQQDSEPMLAVNPANPNQIVATAFTPDPMGSGMAPYFFSTDGGDTWSLNTVVPGGNMTGDITVAFSGTIGKLYAGILRQDSPNPFVTRMNILRTDDFSSATEMEVLDDREQPDQPFAQAVTVTNEQGRREEHLYVGSNDFAAKPSTATVDISFDAGAAEPNFTSVRIERRSTAGAGQDGPQVRTAIHANGTIYAAFCGWRSQAGDFSANTLQVTADVVVARDDQRGRGANPFEDLKDPDDGTVGIRVARGVRFAFNRTGLPNNGQQRLGGTLAVAVDPRADKSGTVYLAWGSDEQATGFTIHVQRSNDRGETWSPDLLTLPRSTNAALAVNSDGVAALLSQQLTGVATQMRWETHLRRTTDGGANWSDLVLASTPANFPLKTFDPYLGDYDHLVSVGRDFYGIFSASNAPDRANFPNGITYQRNADFDIHELLDVDNRTQVQVSIDPFFFKVTG
jgi:hypothetical protein